MHLLESNGIFLDFKEKQKATLFDLQFLRARQQRLHNIRLLASLLLILFLRARQQYAFAIFVFEH
jgi:hypothetical protein